MPRLATLGLASGAGAGLEDLLVQRHRERQSVLEERKFAELQRQAQAEEEFRRQQLQEQGELRKMQLGETIRKDQEAEQMKRVSLAMLRPIGSEVSPEEMTQETKAGVPRGLYDITPGSPELPEGDQGPRFPSVIRFQGKQADIAKKERDAQLARDASERDKNADLDRQMRLTIAQLAAASKAGGQWAEPTVNIQDPTTGAVIPVPRSVAADPAKAAEFVSQYREAGMRGPLTAQQRERVDFYRDTLGQISRLEDHIKKHGWTGVGPISGTLGAASYGLTGKGGGGAIGEDLRTKINTLRAQASFQEGGKQFTGTEKQLLESFLVLSHANPKQAAVRLGEFKQRIQNTLASLGVNKPTAANVLATPAVPGAAVGVSTDPLGILGPQ